MESLSSDETGAVCAPPLATSVPTNIIVAGNEHPSSILTSAITVLSSAHGRKRRAERQIGKRDLKAAVKHGTREPGRPTSSGEPTWKYTFADVVYITDSTSRKEITSWPETAVPCKHVDIESVLVGNIFCRRSHLYTTRSAA